jgi:N-acetylneuraminic acid mutarotase
MTNESRRMFEIYLEIGDRGMQTNMKAGLLNCMGATLLVLSGCGGGNSPVTQPTPPTPPAVHNEWTWQSGLQVANQTANYGTLGTAAEANTPGARLGAMNWIDSSGNFWLFGGQESLPPGQSNYLNDLWEYSKGQWTWVGGSNEPGGLGVYGTQGQASADNIPGGRSASAYWKDASGNLWLFGGAGVDSKGYSNFLDDLWKYSNGQWTWVAGPNLASLGLKGVYGTLGVASPSNLPGGRIDPVTWIDAAGDLWLFGGGGYDSNGNLSSMNDVWKFVNGQWTWIGGSNVGNQAGIYGTQGVSAASNIPGGRYSALSWTDAKGNIWLFGGADGFDGSGNYFDDLWEYSSSQWTWVGGSSAPNQSGVYGTQGTAAATNLPGARCASLTWVDSAGNFWLFGGDGYDSAGNSGFLSDLWKYSNGQWTWVSGPTLAAKAGSYGTLGTAALGNIPGARDGSANWLDGSGNLWLFGGIGYDANGNSGYLSDMWEYQP